MEDEPLEEAPRSEGRREVTRRRGLRIPRRWPLLLAAALAGVAAGAGGLTLWSRSGGWLSPAGFSSLGPSSGERAVLYFADARWTRLVPEERRMPTQLEAAARIRALVEALIEGPRGDGTPVLPRGLKVRGAYVGRDGLAVIDFDEGLAGFSPGGASGELLSVFALVHTLVQNVPGLKDVQILVGGSERETLAGHVKISEPLRPDPQLLAQPSPQ